MTGAHHDQPGTVDREAPRREPGQPGVFAAANTVFDAGVGSMPGVEGASCPAWGIGGVCGGIMDLQQAQFPVAAGHFHLSSPGHAVKIVKSRVDDSIWKSL